VGPEKRASKLTQAFKNFTYSTLLVTMATAEQRYEIERPRLEEIADSVILTEDFRERLAQRPACESFPCRASHGESSSRCLCLNNGRLIEC
jgi:hypothetical protein